MKNLNEIEWTQTTENIGYFGHSPNVSVGEKIKDGNSILEVVSIWFSGSITVVDQDGNYSSIERKYVSEAIIENLGL